MRISTIMLLMATVVAISACNRTEQRIGGAATGAGAGAVVGGPVGAVVGGAAGAVAGPSVVRGTRRAVRRR